jgi:carboxymethylenebutenolidase
MVSAAAQHIGIQTPDGPMPAHVWHPPQQTGPGLLLIQEIFGVSDYIENRAADLAELGYVVCVPEVYWRLGASRVDESSGDALASAMGLAGRVDWDAAVADVTLALSHLRGMIEVTGGTGLIGFCFGGGLAFNVAAVSDPDVLVSYYGSALGRLLPLAGRVRAPSLHHFGRADSFIATSTQDAIRAAVTQHGARFETYDGAGHAFDNPSPIFHHPEAAAAAWATTKQFLSEFLPVGDSVAAGDRPAA